MPTGVAMTDLPTSQIIVDAIIAIVVAVLAYGATSLVAIRKDHRAGQQDEVDLFNQVKMAAAEQMREMRAELAELRERVDKAEAAAEERRIARVRLRREFNAAMEHVGRLEALLRQQGIQVPIRPRLLSDDA